LYVRVRTSSYRSTVIALLIALSSALGCQHAPADEDRPPSALVATSLTDQDGRSRTLAEFAGKTLIFSLFFTSCPTVCPRETRALVEVQRRLSPALKERVRFVSLSVDPENDTPEAMRRFALAMGADLSGWSFVRADAAATQALAKELNAFAGDASGQAAPSGHTTSVYLFDGKGRLMQRYAGSPLDGARLAREVEALDLWFRKKEHT
jgi:protein SCO1/2